MISFGLLMKVGFIVRIEAMNDSHAKNVNGKKNYDNGPDCYATNMIIGTRTCSKGTNCDDIIIGCPITAEGTGCSSGDTLRGLERHDVLHGSVGDDTLYGDEGNDE